MGYTKGEWKVDPDTEELTVNDSMVLGMVYGAKDYPCRDDDDDEAIERECHANAALIAAAPDLYEALKAVLDGEENTREGIRQVTKQARKALAKAEGK